MTNSNNQPATQYRGWLGWTPVNYDNATLAVATFSDGNSALMLVCARLRHVACSQWGNKKYLNMKHLENQLVEEDFAAS